MYRKLHGAVRARAFRSRRGRLAAIRLVIAPNVVVLLVFVDLAFALQPSDVDGPSGFA